MPELGVDPCILALLGQRSQSSYRYRAKLREPLRQSSEQSLPKTIAVRAKAIVTFELSLFSKLGIITALEFGRGAMASGNPERCQET